MPTYYYMLKPFLYIEIIYRDVNLDVYPDFIPCNHDCYSDFFTFIPCLSRCLSPCLFTGTAPVSRMRQTSFFKCSSTATKMPKLSKARFKKGMHLGVESLINIGNVNQRICGFAISPESSQLQCTTSSTRNSRRSAFKNA